MKKLKLKDKVPRKYSILSLMNDRRTVIFKAGYWYHEIIDGKTLIHIGGRTQNNESVHVIVNYFTPFVYVELPKRINWDKHKCNTLFQFLKSSMKEDGPITKNPVQKYMLYHKKLVYCLYLSFPTEIAAKKLQNKLGGYRGFSIPGLGSFQSDEFKVHEHNIDSIIKFTALNMITLSSWIKAKEYIPTDEEDVEEDANFTSADISMRIDWKDVSSTIVKGNVYVPPTYCSFDIECYSKNKNSKMPDPTIPENVVNQICMTFGVLGDASSRKRILLTLGDPENVENTDEVRKHYYSESSLLLDFKDQILLYDPDIFLGYNIMKFDWDYMIKRAADICHIYTEFAELSRIFGKRADLKTGKWGSSAYGEQVFSYLECHGRTNVDLLIEVERNFRLPTYNLNAVSDFFQIGTKDDLSARDLFMLWDVTTEILPLVSKGEPSLSEFVKLKCKIGNIFPIRKCGSIVREYRKKLLRCKKSEIYSVAREAMAIMGKYCVQDTVLVIDLAEKLNIWTTMEEMSNVTNIPISYLQTRGQQIRVLSQVYRETIRKNIVIPFAKKKKDVEKFQGAMVVEANPGEYKNVCTLDFASLYPSLIIAYNICYTTLLEDNDRTLDSECHVLIWEDHKYCVHDPLKRKGKASDVLCKKHHYRFRKVKYVISEDGFVVRENEGLLPRLLRNLLATRKLYKKDMAKAEAKVKMNSGKATESDLVLYKKYEYDIIQADSLTEKEAKLADVDFGVLNAKQLAVKVSANSTYGILGAQKGYLPLMAGAASVTAMGRRLIIMAIEFILKTYLFAKLVYGDTDSCMIYFQGLSIVECFAMAEEASGKTTHHLKCHITGVDDNYTVGSDKKPIAEVKSTDPYFLSLNYEEKCHVLDYESSPIDLEFENMYGWFLLLTKKRYMAEKVNKKGEVTGETLKGNVLTRRDNSKYLKDTYRELKDKNKNEEECVRVLCDRINMLFTRQIPDLHLIIYMGIKSLVDYAKSVKVEGERATQKIFVDKNGDPIDELIGPMDPRLVYPNIPQVILALKMTMRGDIIPANTRLEFLYLCNDNASHQGEKAEDYTYYKENKDTENLKPDYLHYIEKQLSKPITELFDVRFPKPIIPYICPESQLRKYIDMFTDLQRYRVANLKSYKKPRPVTNEGVYGKEFIVGWRVLRKEGYRPRKKLFKGLCKDLDFTEYTYKNDGARVAYIMDQIKTGTNPNDISENAYPGLLSFCHNWKSTDVIDVKYKEHGITRRRWRKPTYIGPKIRVGTNVVLLVDIGSIKKDTVCKIVDREDQGKGKSMTYIYDLLCEKTEVIIKKVSRSSFTTYVTKGDTMMKNMLDYRIYYGEVVAQLNGIFKKSLLNFCEES